MRAPASGRRVRRPRASADLTMGQNVPFMFYVGRDPERGKPFAGASNMVSQLISLLSKRLSRLRMRPVSGWDFARNSLRELIPLLFRCYSAVSSAVIPLLIPLLFALSFRRQRGNSSRKYLNQHMFSRRDFLEKRPERIFLPINRGIWSSGRPGICSRQAAEGLAVGTTACSKTRMRRRPSCGGGPDSVVFGRRPTARASPGWRTAPPPPPPGTAPAPC
jgi:hypothetical protein